MRGLLPGGEGVRSAIRRGRRLLESGRFNLFVRFGLRETNFRCGGVSKSMGSAIPAFPVSFRGVFR